MRIAYNYAYVQIETVNFTFAQQAVIVYFYLCSNVQEIAVPNAKYTVFQKMTLMFHTITMTYMKGF